MKSGPFIGVWEAKAEVRRTSESFGLRSVTDSEKDLMSRRQYSSSEATMQYTVHVVDLEMDHSKNFSKICSPQNLISDVTHHLEANFRSIYTILLLSFGDMILVLVSFK